MAYKICPKCKKENASSNSTCFKCGKVILREKIWDDHAHKNLKLYAWERLFSSLLVACAVIALFFGLMAFLEQPDFSLFGF